jgi:DNA-binding NtrC family response regulator
MTRQHQTERLHSAGRSMSTAVIHIKYCMLVHAEFPITREGAHCTARALNEEGNVVRPIGSILVVDRAPTIADLLVEILTDAGYIAYTVPNCAGAEVAIARHRPALIVLDVGRNSKRDVELIEHVRAADLAIIPIVVMATAPRDTALLLGLGAAECLAKPFDLDDLLSCVARYVQPDQRANQFACMDARSA